MQELNVHIVENWDTFKNHFSFPYTHSIGIGNADKTFENEIYLKNFLKNDQEAVNMWVDHQWLLAASNLYQARIHILTTGVEVPIWTILEPSSKPNQTVIKKNIYLLHADNSHFDVLVPKLNEREPTEVEILKVELAESK